MIEPTDEMVAAFRDAWMQSMQTDPSTNDPEAVADRAGLKAVLAIVERDRPGPCSETAPTLVSDGYLWCELRHGHAGDHESGPTRWKTLTPPQ